MMVQGPPTGAHSFCATGEKPASEALPRRRGAAQGRPY